MKKIVFAAAFLALAACSSAKKETSSSDVPVAKETTVESTQASTTPVEKVKKAVKEAKATATEAATEATSSGTTFGALNGTEKSSIACSNKGDSRKITVLNVTEGGCGVVYNKAGEDKTVAQAKSAMDYCDTVANKMKSNLEAAGFDCGGATAAAPAAETKTSKE